jgi:hypothetical protein
MHATTRIPNFTTAHRALVAGAVLAVGALVAPLPTTATARGATVPESLHDAFHRTSAVEGPMVMQGDVVDVLVRVRGGAFCSGTPIANTVYVVTAAHCVLDPAGRVGARSVVRDGVTYAATEVLVDTRYSAEPSPRLDAAVLVMDRVLPGPSAALGLSVPSTGSVTLAGFQAVDTDGTLLRGHGPHDAPMPKDATGHLIEIESAPAGCIEQVAELRVTRDRVDVPCGLIPGASGGGLFAADGRSVVLVGIVSTVAPDLSSNGVVPVESLHELLAHPERFRHPVSETRAASDAPRVVLS